MVFHGFTRGLSAPFMEVLLLRAIRRLFMAMAITKPFTVYLLAAQGDRMTVH